MDFDMNVEFLRMAFWQIVMVAGPVLLVALGIGLFIGIIQAATSINEQTLSFVPKLFVVLKLKRQKIFLTLELART